MTLRKLISLFVMGTLTVSALGACSNRNNAEEKVRMEFFQYKSEARGTFNHLIEKFEKENPTIDVVQLNPPDAETVLRTRVVKRDMPDVIGIGGNSTFAILAQSGVLKEVSNKNLENVQPAYTNILQDVTELEKVYGVPYAANASPVIYNKSIFNNLGLEIPKTWDELIDVSEKIKAAGITPFYFTLKDAWTTLPAYNALVANTQDEDFFQQRKKDRVTFQQSYGEATEKFLTLLNYGHKSQYGKGYSDGNVAFARGEAAMYLQGIAAIPEIQKSNPDIKLGTFPYPVTNMQNESKVVSGVDLLLAQSVTTEHPKEAQAFINFLMREENAKEYLKEQNAFSTIKGVFPEDPALAGLLENFKRGLIVDYPDHYIPPAMRIENLLQQLAHDKDKADFLEKLDQEWNKVQERN
ncbi:ABC transporter substrate-binding protein [Priestia endophytica]|uniref:ABC transporter substrate-binding protein n=1 Tax=Priestia endophytica TaxID=135735 RepID=UPI000DCA84F1|nr:extracellular solute-binding protein [Priestia endophytica]RAS87787.1 ABC transporter substrate-binding protein [Priestia endophytica]